MKKTVKITQKQLQSIISEEAIKYKKVLELQKKRESIVKQLNEMYDENCATEEGTVDEGLFGPSRDELINKERLTNLAQAKIAQVPKGMLVGTLEGILQKAKSDGYMGKVDIKKSTDPKSVSNGKYILMYIPAPPTNFQKMATAAAGQTTIVRENKRK